MRFVQSNTAFYVLKHYTRAIKQNIRLLQRAKNKKKIFNTFRG